MMHRVLSVNTTEYFITYMTYEDKEHWFYLWEYFLPLHLYVQ